LSILLFQVVEALIDLGLVFSTFLACFILLIIETYQVLASNIEAIEVLHCWLRAENILVDHEGGAFGLSRVAFADLSQFAVFAEDVVKFIGAYLVRKVADEEDAVDLGRELFLLHHNEILNY